MIVKKNDKKKEYIAEGDEYVAIKGQVGGKRIVTALTADVEVEVITAEEQQMRIAAEEREQREQELYAREQMEQNENVPRGTNET